MINIPEQLSMAVHTLAALAADPGVPRSGREIAEAHGWSHNHLAKVQARLVHAGLVKSRCGKAGGILFTRKPGKVTLAMIRDAVCGAPSKSKYCLLPGKVCPGNRCALGRFITKMEAEFKHAFARTTLADILRDIQPKKRVKKPVLPKRK